MLESDVKYLMIFLLSLIVLYANYTYTHLKESYHVKKNYIISFKKVKMTFISFRYFQLKKK